MPANTKSKSKRVQPRRMSVQFTPEEITLIDKVCAMAPRGAGPQPGRADALLWLVRRAVERPETILDNPK